MKNEKQGIFNYLDHMTIEDAIKYAAQGYRLIINDGHVQAMIPEDEEVSDGE